MTVYDEVRAERERAHRKHKNSPGGSIEDRPAANPRWFTVLGEEYGEVCKALNDYEHGLYSVDDYWDSLHNELIQVAAVACAWADKIRREMPA